MNKDNINKALDEGKGVSDNVDELLTEIKNAKDETAPISTSTVTSLIMSVIVLINTIFLIFREAGSAHIRRLPWNVR